MLPSQPQPKSPATRPETTLPDIRQYIGVVLRRSWVIATVFGLVFVGTVIYVSSVPSVYEATSKIVIVTPPGQRYIGALEQGGQPVGGAGVALGTEARMVQSRLRAEKTAARIRKDHPKLSPPITPDQIVASLATETIEPDEIRIHARHTDPVRARLIANTTAEICVEESTKEASIELTNRRRYIEDLVKKIESDLRKAETEVANYIRKNGLLEEALVASPSTPAKRGAGAGGQLSEFAAQRAERRRVAAQLTATKRYLASLREKLRSLSPTEEVPTLLEDPLTAELRKRLTSLEVDLVQARAKYTDRNPKIGDLRDEIAEVKQKLVEHNPTPVKIPTTQPNPLYDALRQSLLDSELKVVELEAQEEALDAEIKKSEAVLKDLPEKRQRLEELNRIADGLSRRYATLLDKLQDARIDEAVQQGNVRIADIAGIPRKPVSPPRRKMLLFAIVLGLSAGVGLAFLLDYLDTAVQTPEDIERHVGLPCLGFVPMVIDESPGSIITVRKPKSPASEAYRMTRSTLKYASVDAPLQTMCVTSAGAGEGKSVTAANLSTVIAEGGTRVIVVDTDLRRPSLHRLLEADNEFGLTNVLAGDMTLQRALQPTLVDGLLLLASGPLPPNPSELLDSQRMTELIEELKGESDLILFDTPPMLVVTDASIMASKTDATLLVAEAGRVSREALQKCHEIITSARGKTAGVLLNKVRLTKATSYYYYYYYREYYYYGYYGDSARGRRRRARRT